MPDFWHFVSHAATALGGEKAVSNLVSQYSVDFLGHSTVRMRSYNTPHSVWSLCRS